MATDTRNLPAFLADDATFRTWGSGVAAQIAAMGLVQTGDTGQINWTTVTRPAINTSAGYEVWRFNDALQSTKPVFIRLDYGIAGVADRPRIIARVGTATDGAGTLTGQFGGAVTSLPTASKTAGVLLPSLCAGSASRLNLFTHVDPAGSASTYGIMIFVERTKTSAGVNTGDGIATWIASPNTMLYQAIPFSGSIPASSSNLPAVPLGAPTGAISSVGASVGFSPSVVCLGKTLFASWASYVSADIPKLVPISLDHLGAVHTMMPLGDAALFAANPTFVQNPGSAVHSLALLWE
jgi:hypothetical protein